MTKQDVDVHLLEEITHRLHLRKPNAQAVQAVAIRSARHTGDSTFECVVDVATGVGKTYVMAGLIEYYAGRAPQSRNFLVFTPGRTICDKTIANFTRGHRRSLMPMLMSQPYLVTADNFNTPATRSAIADQSRTKVYVFTIQSLLAPTTKVGRKTHDFVEGLGDGFYGLMSSLDDLVVLADEHHCYAGPQFSKTIKNLKPKLVVGLTATPRKQDESLLAYRYPLAAAIADGFVKTPVIVGRNDDRNDDPTKLADGVSLLKHKARVAAAYCNEHDLPLVNPCMLLSAQSIEDAKRYQDMLESDSFDGGAWIGTTLLVHSDLTADAKEAVLAKLDAVEEPDSPVRIIIQVGMLKEGWDVKNVYVIASMRSSISDVLTEQTLGRGMRLPFGAYTGVEFLDTLEVIAHERYEALLEKKDALNAKFIDTYLEETLSIDLNGETVVDSRERTVEIGLAPVTPDDAPERPAPRPGPTAYPGQASFPDLPAPIVVSMDMRRRSAEGESDLAEAKPRQYAPLPDRPHISIPKLKTVPKPHVSSLNLITEEQPFVALGRALREEVSDDLKRTAITAKRDTKGSVTVGTRKAQETIQGVAFDVPLEESRRMLIKRILADSTVPKRAAEAAAAKRIVGFVIKGMGTKAETHLSAYLDRCAKRVVRLVAERMNATSQQMEFEDVLELVQLDGQRTSKLPRVSEAGDVYEARKAYNSWKKNLYSHAWFDSKPEYFAARAIDNAPGVRVWARLHRNDTPIQWNSAGQAYNPDIVVIEDVDDQRVCWLVETKRNSEIQSGEVQAKRQAAKTWANTVNGLLPDSSEEWRYLLLSEDDVADAKGSWGQMKGFGS